MGLPLIELRCGESILTPAVAIGAGNTMLLARARHHSVTNFAGPLSIKYVVRGAAAWKTGRNSLWSDASSFLILNRGEEYSLLIDAPDSVETCCVFFQNGFVESVARSLTLSEDQLLDDPSHSSPELPFISRLHSFDQPLLRSLLNLRRRALQPRNDDALAHFSQECEAAAEDSFISLAEQLLCLYKEMEVRIARLPAERMSTSVELFKRLERGREFLHAHPTRKVPLSQIAAAACLSPSHFHRSFKAAFGKTPHAYLSTLRFDRAAQMLSRGVPVTQACFEAGFESVGSFSSLFHKTFGLTPSKFARSKKRLLAS